MQTIVWPPYFMNYYYSYIYIYATTYLLLLLLWRVAQESREQANSDVKKKKNDIK